jgi:hypothetical protein
LSTFALEREESVKDVTGKKEYDEVKLRAWLTGKYHDDITEEFGPI